MFDEVVLGGEFFDGLARTDAEIMEIVRAQGCPRCGGALHRGDYARKPRGGSVAVEGEAQVRRFSLCCSQEGCRRRATPPSVRFLGRRVYIEAAVIVASAVGNALHRFRAGLIGGVPARTVGRWLSWWRGAFIASAVFVAIKAGFVGGFDSASLPRGILDRMAGSEPHRVETFASWLAPLTTMSVPTDHDF